MTMSQVVLLVDLQGSVDADEVLAVIPPAPGARHLRRLTDFGARALPAPPEKVPAGEWETLRRAIEAMGQWFQDLVKQGAVTLYVGGQGPLPVFTHLGQVLSRFSGEQHFVARRYGGAWEVIPLSDGPHVTEVEWLDVKTGFATVPSEAAGGVAIYLDTGGRHEPVGSITEAVEAEGTWLSHLVVARTSSPLTVDPNNAASLAREVVTTLSRLPSMFPHAERWMLFVAGPSSFAFMVGRALNPNVYAAIGLTHHHAGRYSLVYDLPDGVHRQRPVRLGGVEVEGFYAFERASFELGPINVLIGPNGAGKSSLVKLFGMLGALVTERLQLWVAKQGRSSSVLHWGPKHTAVMRARVSMKTAANTDWYEFALEPTAEGALAFRDERLIVARDGAAHTRPLPRGRSLFESALLDDSTANDPAAAAFRWLLRGSRTFHVHDTSSLAEIRGVSDASDARALHEDAGNLAAVLARLKRWDPWHYRRILMTLRRVLPFFDDFELRDADDTRVRLNWRHRHQPGDDTLGPHQLSDGSLRAMALYTLLLLPEVERPRVIVLDEPELGLHPAAISLLAALIREASQRTQFILATQSTYLLDQFEPEEVVVVESVGGASSLRRPDAVALRQWRDEFECSVSDHWEMNLFGGIP